MFRMLVESGLTADSLHLCQWFATPNTLCSNLQVSGWGLHQKTETTRKTVYKMSGKLNNILHIANRWQSTCMQYNNDNVSNNNDNNKKTSGQSNWTFGRIAAVLGSFNRIFARWCAPPSNTWFLGFAWVFHQTASAGFTVVTNREIHWQITNHAIHHYLSQTCSKQLHPARLRFGITAKVAQA